MSFVENRAGVGAIFGSWDQLTIDIGDNGLFLELAAKIQITNYLEQMCDQQEEFWRNRNADLQRLLPASRLSIPKINRVDPKNIFTGARPSLIRSPIEFWPSITIRTGDLRPSRVQPDQYDTYDADLYIEVMTYAGPVDQAHLHLQEGVDAEGDVNTQLHLISNALLMTIREDPTFGGAIMPIQNPPRITPSFPTAQAGSDQERTGDYYLYQGRQLLFTITRNSF